MSEEIERTNPKPLPVDRLSLLWRRVNDHKMVQWGVAYVALAYGIQHGVTLTSEAFDWPHAVARISMLLLALGLPLVMTLAWYHGMRASRHTSRAELSIIAILLVIGSLFFYVFVQPSADTTTGATRAVHQASVAAGPSTAQEVDISVAVLPFDNLSDDKQQEFFSDGMTDEIATALAKVPDLRVVARSSAFEFKGQNKEARAIGQALGATHLIEGSVRQAGNRVRITAQLVRADNGLQIWAENYDRDLTDIFAVQEDIARAITASLRMPLGLKPGENLVNNRNIDPQSYQDFLRAKALRLASRPANEAIALLQQVVARDPDYAPAWALLAERYSAALLATPAIKSGSSEQAERVAADSILKEEAAAQRAIALDPNQSDVLAYLGQLRVRRGKLVEADELYTKALTLDPNNPETLMLKANVLAGVGRLQEALALVKAGLAIDPLTARYKANGITQFWLNGQDDTAVSMAKGLQSDYAFRAYYLANLYASQGHYGDAADALAQTPPGAFLPGTVEEAVRLLRTAPKAAASPQTLPRLGQLGFVYLSVGAPERTLEYDEDAAKGGYLTAITFAQLWHPEYAPLRKTQRFKNFLRTAGVVEYWRAKGWPPQCHPTTADDFACE